MNNVIAKEINDYNLIDLLNYIGTIPTECHIYKSVYEDDFSKCTCTHELINRLVDESSNKYQIDTK